MFSKKTRRKINLLLTLAFCLNFAFSSTVLAYGTMLKVRSTGDIHSESSVVDEIGKNSKDGGAALAALKSLARRLKLSLQSLTDFQNIHKAIVTPALPYVQKFVQAIKKNAPQKTPSAFGFNLPAGTVDVDSTQLKDRFSVLAEYGLKVTGMKITRLKGELDSNQLLEKPENVAMLETALSQVFGSTFYGGFTGPKKEVDAIKVVMDANAVKFSDMALRAIVNVNKNWAYVIKGDEGKRDNSISLEVGSIYYSEYGQDVRKVFADKKQFAAEIERLEKKGVILKGFIGDALEVTNGMVGKEAIDQPTNSWGLATMFNTLLGNSSVNDKARKVAISYHASKDAEDLNPFDLPSVGLLKIAEAKGINVKNSIELANWMNKQAVYVLGPRDVKKDNEAEIHRNQAIIDDIKALQQIYKGMKFVTNGDGDAMPRMFASAGMPIVLEGKEYELTVFGRGGATEIAASNIVANNVPGGRLVWTYVSDVATKSDYRAKDAKKFTKDELEEFEKLGVTAEEYNQDKWTQAAIKGNGVAAMASVTGANSKIFGEVLANLLQRAKTTRNGETGETITSTFLSTEDGSVFVVTTQFATEDLNETKQTIKSASDEGKKYLAAHPEGNPKGRYDRQTFKNEMERMLVQEFGSEKPELIANLRRIYDHGILAGTGKLLILPIDQFVEHDAMKTGLKNRDIADIWLQVMLAHQLGLSGYVTHPGEIGMIAEKWAKKIPLIAKMNASTDIGGRPKKQQHSVLLGEVKEMARLGVAALGFTIYPGSTELNEQMEELKDLVAMGKEYNLPVIVWSYPRGPDNLKQSQDETALDVTVNTAKLALAAGAHIVKIKPPSEFFKGEQSMDDYKKMFNAVFGHAYDAKNKDDAKNMDHLRFGQLSEKDLADIFSKTKDHEYNAKNENDKKIMKDEIEAKIRPGQKAELIKRGYDFRTLEKRIEIVKHFGAWGGRRKLIFSGGEAKGDEEVLREIAAIHWGTPGGDGDIVGRNLFQRPWIESIDLGQKILAVIIASMEKKFASVDDLLKYALEVQLPKVKAELDIPTEQPEFTPEFTPEVITYDRHDKKVFTIPKTGAVIVDTQYLSVGGITAMVEESARLKNVDYVLVGPHAEFLRILSGDGSNIFITENYKEAVELLQRRGIEPENIKAVNTQEQPALTDAKIKQFLVAKEDSTAVLMALAKSVMEVNYNSDSEAAFTGLLDELIAAGVISQESNRAKILAVIEATTEQFDGIISTNVVKTTEQQGQLLEEIASKAGV